MNTLPTDPLTTMEEVQAATLLLAQQAQREIAIFTPVIEPDLYNTAALVDALLQLTKRSRYTRIRILTSETRQLGEKCHRLLKLLRVNDEQFLLRKTTTDPAGVTLAYLICDDHSMIRRQNAALFKGVCYANDRARIREQMDDFNLLWSSSGTDANLRQLTL